MRRRIRLALVGRMRTSVRCIPVAELLDPEPSVGIEEDLHHAVVREVGTDGTERANERVVSPNLTLGGRVAKRKGPLRPHSLAVNTRAVAVHNWQVFTKDEARRASVAMARKCERCPSILDDVDDALCGGVGRPRHGTVSSSQIQEQSAVLAGVESHRLAQRDVAAALSPIVDRDHLGVIGAFYECPDPCTWTLQSQVAFKLSDALHVAFAVGAAKLPPAYVAERYFGRT
jgi:hypothetical protein